MFVFTAADSIGNHGTAQFAESGKEAGDQVVSAIVLEGFEIDAPDARLVAVGSELASFQTVLNAAFGDRLRRQAAGGPLDVPQRALLDEIGVASLLFTRRSKGHTLDESLVDVDELDLADLAAEAHALFNVVWELASTEEVPQRVEVEPPAEEG